MFSTRRRIKFWFWTLKTSRESIDRSRAHQSFLAGCRGGDGQVPPPGVEGVDLDAPVGLGLPQPHAQHLLDVDALPGADAGVHLDLERADVDVSAAVRHRHEARDLQEDGGGLAGRAQVHPQLRPHDAAGLELGRQGEEAAPGLPVHLHGAGGCGPEGGRQ